MGTTARDTGTKLMVGADSRGAPLEVCVEKASLSEVTVLVVYTGFLRLAWALLNLLKGLK